MDSIILLLFLRLYENILNSYSFDIREQKQCFYRLQIFSCSIPLTTRHFSFKIARYV